MIGLGRRRRFAFIAAALIGIPLAVLLVVIGLVAALALSGMSIDASRWRDVTAQRVSAALGRPVILQGTFEIELRLGRELGLRVGALRVLNPPGFSKPEFLAIGELRANVDLFDALRGRLRSSRIEVRDGVLWLERRADGQGNWASTPQRDSSPTLPAIDIARIDLRELDVHYHDVRSATRRVVQLDELYGSAGRDRPLHLAARGPLEPGRAFSIEIDGGPLRLLQGDAEAWPFTFDARTRGARLFANGALDARQRTAGFQLEANAEDLAPIERLLGAKLPQLGNASVHAAVRVAADALHVSRLHAWLGESELSGQLELAFGGARPRLSGALNAAALDLRPFLTVQSQAQGFDDDPKQRLAMPLRDLLPFDVALDLKVERWPGLNIDLRDASFEWRADRRGLRVPMSATLAGVPVAGGLELDTSAPRPTLVLQLGANNAALGDLVRGLGITGGVEGHLGRVGLRIAGQGDTLAALTSALDFSLALQATRLSFDNPAGSGRMGVALDTLELALRRGDRLRGQARGTLQGQRARLSLRGGTLHEMLHERTLPLELDLALDQTRLQVESRLALAHPARDTVWRFDLQARRAGDLARWLGVAPQASLPVALRGRLYLSDGDWRLERTTLELGRSQLTVDAHSTLAAGRPGIVASVHSPLIDVPELSTLRVARTGARSDAPAFSAALESADADIDVKLQRLRLGRTDVEDLALIARSRDGHLLPMSFTGKVAGAPFTANVELDLQADLPLASLDLSTGAIDLGALLRGLGLADDIDGHAQALQLELRGRGSNLGEWVAHSAFDLRMNGGQLSVRGPVQRPVAEVRVGEARIAALAGKPVRVRLDGEIDHTPVRIDLTSGTLADFAGDARRLPFSLKARAADAQLALDGEVSLPLGSGGQLRFEMRGERLDSLSGLARVELPAWGPWFFSGPIRMTPTGYELQGLQLGVGHSRLSGSGKLDLSGPRPVLDVQVAAPSIQLDDFPLPQRLSEPSPPPGDGRGLRRSASRTAGRTEQLLSAAFLRRLDATVDVQAKEVLAGNDRLADGGLHLQLREGRLDLNPAVVNLPGGAVRLSVSYDLKESEVDFAVAAYIERFDYGIIARRLGRAEDLRGLFSMNLELAGTAPSLDTVMRNASGKVDFAVWPNELRSGVFNLWSVNLVLQLMPLIDPGAQTQVNCIVGRFDLEHGKLSGDKILIDTTAVRILGTGHADMATEQLDFVFRPRAKGLALFRLQTPLRVTGKLGDQSFGFVRSDMPESVLRLIASPILVPIERFTLGPLPRDGADVCTDPLRAVAR